MAAALSFLTLLSYDFRYAFRAIRSYYAIADEIILGLDADRLSWSRKPFAIDMAAFSAFISEVDRQRKIRIIEGDFHSHARSMDNDTAERSELARECAPGNWVVQIDSDEVLMNPDEFRSWLERHDPPGDVGAGWVSVFKIFGQIALVIDPTVETIPIATRSRDAYAQSRNTGRDYYLSPLRLLHVSWGRSPQEVREKLEHWSHSDDFDVDAFYQLWESVTLQNFHLYRDFHPIRGPMWPGLKAVRLPEFN